MAYLDWFNSHAKKHQKILEKLKDRSDGEIIEYFRWGNMLLNEPDFCPLYKDKKKCHDMDELNCYLCACPNFRFDDDAKVEKSFCAIDSKDGAKLTTKSGVVHQDCSKCRVPHHEKYIKKVFSRDWLEIMKDVKS